MIIKEPRVRDHVHLDQYGVVEKQEKRCALSLLFKEELKQAERAGEQVGYESATGELTALIALMHTLTSRLLDAQKSLLERLKPELLSLALLVCEKVMRQELAEPEKLTLMIEELIKLCASERITVYMAPDDLHLLSDRLQQFRGAVAFHQDPLIQRGDCRIETPLGVHNHQLARALQELEEQMCAS